jgi:hypothetical protein
MAGSPRARARGRVRGAVAPDVRPLDRGGDRPLHRPRGSMDEQGRRVDLAANARLRRASLATVARARGLGPGAHRPGARVPGLEPHALDRDRRWSVRPVARRRPHRRARRRPAPGRPAAPGHGHARAPRPPRGGAWRTAALRHRRSALGDLRRAGFRGAPHGAGDAGHRRARLRPGGSAGPGRLHRRRMAPTPDTAPSSPGPCPGSISRSRPRRWPAGTPRSTSRQVRRGLAPCSDASRPSSWCSACGRAIEAAPYEWKVTEIQRRGPLRVR